MVSSATPIIGWSDMNNVSMLFYLAEFVEDVSKTNIGTEAGALMGDTLKYLRTELDKLRTPSQ